MTHRQPADTGFVSAALQRPSRDFTYRFYLAASLFLLMLFLLHIRYSEVGFFIVVLVNVVFCADIFVRSAYADLLRGKIGFAALVSVSVYAGFFYSALHTFLTRPIAGPVEELYLYVSVFLTLALWAQGRRVQDRERAGVYIKKIDDFLPKAARKYVGGRLRKVFVNELKAGDEVLVRPGERLPCDGVLSQGESAIDEELITGNMLPAYKKPGNTVYAGTINKSADIYVTVTQPLAASSIMSVIKAVQEGERRRSHYISELDTYSAWTFVAIWVVAMGKYIFLLYQHGLSAWLQESGVFLVFLALCAPIALVFAEIFPLYFGKSYARSQGINIQNPYALAQLAQAHTVFFDKTGTLTYGKLSVHNIYPVSPKQEKELLACLACAEQQVDGPFAMAIKQYVAARHQQAKKHDSLEFLPGEGVRVTCGRHTIVAGSIQWLEAMEVRLPKNVYKEAQAVVCVAKDKTYLGYITLGDSVRPGAAEAVEFLKQQDKKVALISGDNELSVNTIAQQVGIDKKTAHVLPKTKAEIVNNMRALGKKVIMVGDGFNDIIALLSADGGIAFSSAKNIYNNWVDILISRHDLYVIEELFLLHAKWRRMCRFNAVLAFVSSVCWVEFLYWRTQPVADWRWTIGGSIMIVVLLFLNSMRLLKLK